jgi:hypothetical protein
MDPPPPPSTKKKSAYLKFSLTRLLKNIEKSKFKIFEFLCFLEIVFRNFKELKRPFSFF